MGRQTILLIAVLAAFLAVVGQARAQGASHVSGWQHAAPAADGSPAPRRSAEAVEVTAGFDGAQVWRARSHPDARRMGGAPSARHRRSAIGATREGILSSLIGDRQLIDFLVRLLSGEGGARSYH